MQLLRLRKSLSGIFFTSAMLGVGISSALAQDYIVPRTVDGQPDLQGLWTNDTITPIERPTSLQGREFLTEDEI
ncbi:MAG: hypothetical protein QGG54_18775, partial [Gammaproteobacteria bacterium]|nr:hypothetical protein [Gammaproteobacteria bacterium]